MYNMQEHANICYLVYTKVKIDSTNKSNWTLNLYNINIESSGQRLTCF